MLVNKNTDLSNSINETSINGTLIKETSINEISLNDTPMANRIHIGFFGRRNAGKSSLVNAIAKQEISIVSPVAGTTTDPVYKAMELQPLGPVVLIDTPGFDDVGELGEKRVAKTMQVLNKTDIAVLVIDGTVGFGDREKIFIESFKKKEIPYLIAWNKSGLAFPEDENTIMISTHADIHIEEFKERLANLIKQEDNKIHLVSDFVKKKEQVLLVVPIDESAPKGRLILPQQQVIRDCLEAGAIVTVVKDTEIEEALKIKPSLVITDSQLFNRISKIVPNDIYLTSFSILMARMKGSLKQSLEAVHAIDNLKDYDKILMAEACSHHRQCQDIGTVKIPAWLREYTGKELIIDSCMGSDFPEDLSKYALVIHCGGCMISERELRSRLRQANEQNVAFTNYGLVIAYMNGILERSIKLFQNYE